MSKRPNPAFHTIALCLAALCLSPAAIAADVKMVGVVEKIQLAADGKSAQATVKDGKSGKPVVILVTDDETLDKFKDKRISAGDEIRTKFDDADKNLSKSFKKTAGC